MTILLLAVTAGCKSDGTGPMSSLAGSDLDALLDSSDPEIPAPPKHQTVALASSSTTATKIRTLQEGEDLLELAENAPGVVLVDFYADWCGPCRKQAKVLHEMEEFASSVDAQIIKVDVDQHRRLARKYKVSSLPSLLVLQDGVVRHSKTGLTSRDEIESMLR